MSLAFSLCFIKSPTNAVVKKLGKYSLIFTLIIFLLIVFPGMCNHIYINSTITFFVFIVVLSKAFRLFRKNKRSEFLDITLSLLFLLLSLLLAENILRFVKPIFIPQSIPKFHGFSEVDKLIDFNLMHLDSFGVAHMERCELCPWKLNNDGFPLHYELNQHALDSAHNLGKRAILVIGDSYTFGNGETCWKSYVDFISENNKSYQLWNMGIPASGFPQYEAVINEFVIAKGFKPDCILIGVCGANDLDDVVLSKTPVIPGYFTNAGLLPGSVLWGIRPFYNAQQSYEYLNNGSQVLRVFGVWGAYLCTSQLFKQFIGSSIRFISDLQFLIRTGMLKNALLAEFGDYRFVQARINHIEAICSQVKVPVILILIPGLKMIKKGTCPHLNHVVCLDPKIFTTNDYSEASDDHPRISGHKKIAIGIEEILNAHFK